MSLQRRAERAGILAGRVDQQRVHPAGLPQRALQYGQRDVRVSRRRLPGSEGERSEVPGRDDAPDGEAQRERRVVAPAEQRFGRDGPGFAEPQQDVVAG